jgi:hypothetical protein
MNDLDELLGSMTRDLRTTRRNIACCPPSPERDQMLRDHKRILEQWTGFLQRTLAYVQAQKHWPLSRDEARIVFENELRPVLRALTQASERGLQTSSLELETRSVWDD